MKTLDEVLSERAQEIFKNRLAEILDPSTWDASNRDAKMEEMRKVSTEVADEAHSFVRDLLETEVHGRSILWWKVMEQFIGAEYELLLGFFDQLNNSNDTELSAYPFDYEWLIKGIRQRVKEVSDLERETMKAFDPNGLIEEL